jgi:hypothetical protein
MRLRITYIVFLCLLSISVFPQTDPWATDTSMIRVQPKDTCKRQNDVEKLYQSIRSYLFRNRVYKELFYALFRDHKFTEDVAKITQSTNPFEPYSGKTIRKIEVLQLNVFGPAIEDTISCRNYQRPPKGFSSLHINTSEKVIRKNIIFKSGDTLNPYVLAQNAKLLRELSYIQDALIKIYLNPDNTIDVFVITKDRFPWDVIPIYLNTDKWRFRLRNNNVGGYGGEFNNTYLFDNKLKEKVYLSNLSLKYNNIGGSFINSDLGYEFSDNYSSYYANFQRAFVPYKVNWAGGLTFNQSSQTNKVLQEDNTNIFAKFKQNYSDAWLGKQIPIQSNHKLGLNSPIWLIPSVRYSRIDYFDKPNVKLPEFSLRSYHMFLASIGLSSQKYYRIKYVNEYGKTEDIQQGFMAKATGGYQIIEGRDRAYAGLRLGYRNKDNRDGLYYFLIDAGTFIHLKRYSQATLKLRASYLFPLLDLGREKMRPIFWIDYVLGLNRDEGERIFLENPDATNRVILSDLYGTQKLLAHAESNVFTSIDFYGFKVSTFAAIEFGFIDYSHNLFDTPLVSAFSVGVRVKNDFLIFNTIQFRLTFYSNNLSNYVNSSFDVNEMNRLRFDDFSVGRPYVINY